MSTLRPSGACFLSHAANYKHLVPTGLLRKAVEEKPYLKAVLILTMQGALDGLALRLRQVFGQRVEFEPLDAVNLDVSREGRAGGAAAEDDLQLLDVFDRAHESQLDAIKLKADLFAQLAAHGVFGLLACVDEAAGHAPAAARSKDMLQQQDAARFIRHYRARRHREARLRHQDDAAPQTHRQATIDGGHYSFRPITHHVSRFTSH